MLNFEKGVKSMIYVIGEILADMIGGKSNDSFDLKVFCGGAPFNVAVNSKQAGAKVGFLGRVGKDLIGSFLEEESKKANLDVLTLQKDPKRNTTLAFVTLSDGERDFSFFRNDTADYNIDLDSIDFSQFEDINIMHLGTLMLSEKSGRSCAKKFIKIARKIGAKLSFDLNFRKDTYQSEEQAVKIYKEFIQQADIIKFSEDELALFTGIEDVKLAIQSFYKKDTLVLVTLGAKGSAYYYNGNFGIVETEKVKPIDTTGAGDAFFGTFLANIESKEYTDENLKSALLAGNKAGAKTTQFLGAIKL